MRIFAISDLHVDHPENARWVSQLSSWDYLQDALICAGDITHTIAQIEKTLVTLKKKFRVVAYLPGNHELWVKYESTKGSLEKFSEIQEMASDSGVHTGVAHLDAVSLVPVLAWYDHSFAAPSEELLERWADYHMCRWPDGFAQPEITQHFLLANPPVTPQPGRKVISFSHFVPRNDLLPLHGRTVDLLRPALGSKAIDAHIRKLGSSMHIYGHYHVNQRTERDGITYINNAFGYPRETHIAAKQLVCVYE